MQFRCWSLVRINELIIARNHLEITSKCLSSDFNCKEAALKLLSLWKLIGSRSTAHVVSFRCFRVGYKDRYKKKKALMRAVIESTSKVDKDNRNEIRSDGIGR